MERSWEGDQDPTAASGRSEHDHGDVLSVYCTRLSLYITSGLRRLQYSQCARQQTPRPLCTHGKDDMRNTVAAEWLERRLLVGRPGYESCSKNELLRINSVAVLRNVTSANRLATTRRCLRAPGRDYVKGHIYLFREYRHRKPWRWRDASGIGRDVWPGRN
ncbi:hypothetical protein EVAR_76485_1 [Eumeta japonica]|uniref:Uncharacterized protein n=1 Tax=Eumeta variegata TaxID=151549 RepID=A0A4C1T7J7_EUMVA|nr:hypothetical protein EVAR_76485_1 [Eumeta japonica]